MTSWRNDAPLAAVLSEGGSEPLDASKENPAVRRRAFAVQRAVLSLAEPHEAFYLIRLAAFALIISAIVDKNRAVR